MSHFGSPSEAMAGTMPVRVMDGHFIPVDVGSSEHGLVIIFRLCPLAVSELCTSRPASRARCVEGPDRGRNMHVGVRLVFFVPAMHLTARFSTNRRLIDVQAGLEKSRAMAE